MDTVLLQGAVNGSSDTIHLRSIIVAKDILHLMRLTLPAVPSFFYISLQRKKVLQEGQLVPQNSIERDSSRLVVLRRSLLIIGDYEKATHL
jgi:hypothetical protein